MFKRMLVLLDGSKLAEVVISYAKELSGRLGLDLDLLYVSAPEQAQQQAMLQNYVDIMAEMLQAQSEKVRDAAGAESGRKPLKAVGKVVVGYPAEEILKYIDENKIDIMMLATHGRSGIRRWGLGSVADKVIHEANIPIWLVPGALHEGILYDKIPGRTLLVPLDGSALAEEALPYVIALAKQRGVETKAVLINVTKPIDVKVTVEEAKTIIGKDIRSLQTSGEVYLQKIVKQLKDAGVEADYEQLVGDPAEEIVRYAANLQPRVIIMSTHGRSGFSRFVFGSVTENVLHRLQKTPVFLVRSSQK